MSFSFVNLLVLAVSAQLSSGGSESYSLLSIFSVPFPYRIPSILFRLSALQHEQAFFVVCGFHVSWQTGKRTKRTTRWSARN